ncbi:MAG: 50S ribosomal protein L23 [Candidatus Hydrothermarchaeota archaeon]|nr:50S ribosomal protein L23 [Candidatus Hydrothermarchaeota archaeon]MDP6612952.1 50S ribosomal protein L23 [Candidatus Hydrothermarchaeota archaeon]
MRVIIYPDVTEKSMRLIETENKLVFVVARESNKAQIKTELEKLYEVKVSTINTLITPKGLKKAYVELSPEFKAEEIATRIGIF